MVSAPGRGWPRGYCRGVAGLGGAGAWPPAGLIRSPAVLGLAVGLGALWAHCRGVVVLGCAAGAWVPVGLLLGLVVGRPVLGWACCWCRIGCLGPLEEDHVL